MYPDLSHFRVRPRELPQIDASALLLIDCQEAFLNPQNRSCAVDSARVLERAACLGDAFLKAKRPLIVTRHVHDRAPAPGGMGSFWKSFLLHSDEASVLHPRIRCLKADLVLEKKHYSAFYGTMLEDWLRERKVKSLVLAGFLSHACVDSTARDAFQRGFDVIIPRDACSSIHPRIHEAALLSLSHAVAHISSCSHLAKALVPCKS